jgi:hypothetical protein
MPPSSSPPVSPFQASLTGSGLPYIFNFFPHANTPAFHKILGVVLSNATGNFHRHWTRMFRLVKGKAVCWGWEGSEEEEGVVARRAWSLGRREGVKRRREMERVGSRLGMQFDGEVLPEGGGKEEEVVVVVKGAFRDKV